MASIHRAKRSGQSGKSYIGATFAISRVNCMPYFGLVISGNLPVNCYSCFAYSCVFPCVVIGVRCTNDYTSVHTTLCDVRLRLVIGVRHTNDRLINTHHSVQREMKAGHFNFTYILAVCRTLSRKLPFSYTNRGLREVILSRELKCASS